jgi:hypothetical protein
MNIPFKHEIDEQGNILVNPKILIPNNKNKSIYGEDIEQNNTNFPQIETSMLKQGINDNPIPIYPDKTLKGGHTRLHIATKHAFSKVRIRLLSSKSKRPTEIIDDVIRDNGEMREKNYLHCLNEMMAYETAYLEEYNGIPSDDFIAEKIEIINSGTALPITKNTLKHLKVVKERDINLFDDINTGKISPRKAYGLVKNTQPKDKPRKNRKVLEWMRDKEFNQDILKSFNTARLVFLNKIGYEDEDGNFINLVTGEGTEFEENAITGVYSHLLANATTSVFKRRMPEHGAVSPRKAGDPDTQFSTYDKKGFDPLRLETKYAHKTKKGINFYGGEGATSINPHEYILAVRQGHDDFCIIVATMTKDDWKSRTGGSVSSLDSFLDKHYHEKGKIWYPIIGDIKLGNHDSQFDVYFEKINENNA